MTIAAWQQSTRAWSENWSVKERRVATELEKHERLLDTESEGNKSVGGIKTTTAAEKGWGRKIQGQILIERERKRERERERERTWASL